MKQLIISLSLMLGAAALTQAQQVTGTWEIFPNYGTPTSVVETPDYVYTLSGTSLCGYDKSTGEVAAFNASNRLNGNSVSGIWYDPQEKYLFVYYTDYNIDLLYDDGRLINVPDLRDAAITESKQINQVAFSDGKAYVALTSGMLVIDAAHGAVTESCLWGFKIDHIAVTDKKILVFSTARTENKWFVANKNVSHHNFNAAFTLGNSSVYPNGGAMTLGPDAVLVGNGTNAYVMTVNNDGDNATALKEAPISGVTGLDRAAANMQVSKQGAVITGSGKVYQISPKGELTATHTVDAASGNRVADWDFADNTLWIASAGGYGQYNLTGGNYTISPVKPNGTSGSNVGLFHQTSDGTVYLSTVRYEQGSSTVDLAMKNAYIDKATANNRLQFVLQPKTSLCSFIILPDSKGIITSNFNSGIHHWDADGKATTLVSGWFKTDAQMSADGCLWYLAIEAYSAGGMTLNKATPDWIDNPGNISWSSIHIPELLAGNSCKIFFDEANRNVVITGRSGISVVKMPDTNSPLSDNTQTAYGNCSFDEDGLSLSHDVVYMAVPDKKGQIWCGSDAGVFVIRNSNDVFKSGWSPMRPKVARNDGTNLADLLLDQVNTYCISVDSNNQKWIGTIGSGMYRVSEDGSEIFDHFTTENSDIPSDIVFATMPDANSNKIFVGTDQGLSIYHASSSPAASDYSDVYAYPNPVTPDYTGWITITGLMDNSLVKIADAAGRVFFQGKSDGGSVIWNGCDASGRRVKSGVYFVFASQHQDGGSTNAAVTKIVVVN